MWGMDKIETGDQGEWTKRLRRQMLGTREGGKAETSLSQTECRKELRDDEALCHKHLEYMLCQAS